MKQKLFITFEIPTVIEVDVPEHYSSTANYVVGHHNEIVAEARKKLLDEGIEKHLTWDNFGWCDANIEIDLT